MSRSSTIIEPDGGLLDPIPPGEILLEEFMKPLGISQNQLARDLAIPISRVAGLLKGDRAITADTALRLGKYFETSPDVWLGLQAEFDLRRAPRNGHAEVKSSVIRDIEHDGESRLLVTFVTGKQYAYEGVPTELFREFAQAQSKGAFFNEKIRNVFDFVELTAPRARAPRSAA